MKRWGLWIALMLSLGLNIGVLFMVFADRGGLRRLEEPRAVESLLPDEPPVPAEAVFPGEQDPSSEGEPSPPVAAGPEAPPVAEPVAPPEPRAGPPPGTSPPPASAPPGRPPALAEAPPEPPAAPSPGRAPGADALRRAEPRLEVLADRLRLRGQRRARFLEAQRRFFTEVTARRVELATLRLELRRELTSPAPDRQRIRRILERSGRATAELDAAFAENVLTVRRILGPRQQQAYFRFLERLRNGMDLQNRPDRR